jgi:hypothetical protein
MEKMNVTILSSPKYEGAWDDKVRYIGNINDIINEVEKNDRHYHSMLVNDGTYYSFYMDIDKFAVTEIKDYSYLSDNKKRERESNNIILFCKSLSKLVNVINECLGTSIVEGDIKYTVNSNYKFGFHISIPKLHGTISEIKQLAEIVKNKCYNEYIDLSVYESRRLYRLPGQSKGSLKGVREIGKHLIKCGSTIDFIPEHIQEDSIRITNNSNKIEINKNNTTIELESNDITPETLSECSDYTEKYLLRDCLSNPDINTYDCLRYCNRPEKIHYVSKFCNIINPNRIRSESGWYDLCMILKNELGDTKEVYEIFHNTSKRDEDGYNDNKHGMCREIAVKHKWDTHPLKESEKLKKLGTLIDWCKEDNFDKFNKIKKQLEKKNEKIDKEYEEKRENDEFLEMVINFEKHCCKIRDGGRYIDYDNIDKNYKILDRKALGEKYSDYTIGPKQLSFVNKWSKYKDIKCYRKAEVYPKKDDCPSDVFNLWLDFDIVLKSREYVEKPKELNIILEHIKILCNHEETSVEWFMQWIAFLFQYPWIKSPCPLIKSEQGAGKNMFLELIEYILGKHKHFETTNPDRSIWGSFNSIIADKYLIHLNELSKKQTNDADGKIKAIITDKNMQINTKMIAEYGIDSYHKFIITTNNLDCIKITGGDKNINRRFCFIEASDELVENYEYFNNFSNIIKDKDVQHTFYNYFMNYKVDEKFGTRSPPKTKYFYLAMYMNRSAFANWMDQYVLKKQGSSVRIPAKECYESYKNYCSNTNTKMDGINQNKFCANILNLYKHNVEMKRASYGFVMIFNFDQLNKECKEQQNMLFDDLEENTKPIELDFSSLLD